MSKRSLFVNITPLPAGISRESVISTLHDHLEMIDLQPMVEERHPIKPPTTATPEEFHCQWYALTDKVQYLPGGLYTGKVSYNVCFHNLPTGMQSHVYAPMGLTIRNKWTLGGTLPDEPREAVELGHGIPKEGLWLREDVDMKCNMLLTSFVKKNLKKAHATLVARLVEKAHLNENDKHNATLAAIANSDTQSISSYQPSSPGYPPPLFASSTSNPHDSVSSFARSNSSRHSYYQENNPNLPPGYQLEPHSNPSSDRQPSPHQSYRQSYAEQTLSPYGQHSPNPTSYPMSPDQKYQPQPQQYPVNPVSPDQKYPSQFPPLNTDQKHPAYAQYDAGHGLRSLFDHGNALPPLGPGQGQVQIPQQRYMDPNAYEVPGSQGYHVPPQGVVYGQGGNPFGEVPKTGMGGGGYVQAQGGAFELPERQERGPVELE
jgi:hypothetical protein